MVRIFGFSDDLVGVEGDIEAELNVYGYDTIVHLTDGTVLRIIYDENGIWRVRVEVKGTLPYHLTECGEEDEDYYSDIFESDADFIDWYRYPQGEKLMPPQKIELLSRKEIIDYLNSRTAEEQKGSEAEKIIQSIIGHINKMQSAHCLLYVQPGGQNA